MQTMTRIGTDVSLYLWPDDTVVVIGESDTAIGDPVTVVIADCTLADVLLHIGVEAPADWAPWKYLYDGVQWTPNPDYVAVLD